MRGGILLGNFDFRPGLAQMWKPTLFLCGTKDAALGGLKQMHAAVTGSQLVELPGAGHLSNLEQPEPFGRAIGQFLQDEMDPLPDVDAPDQCRNLPDHDRLLPELVDIEPDVPQLVG